MTPLELFAIAFASCALISMWMARKALPWLLGAATLALAAALIINPARWQLYPAVLALILMAVHMRRGRFAWSVGLGGALLLVVSATLAQLMAMPALPAPSGPYPVGTVTRSICRPTAQGPRHLFLKLWYPARKTSGPDEGLWPDLGAMRDLPWVIRAGLSYLSRAPTHSQNGAPYAADARVRLLLYNHSFVSWASENSLLAEELASRGFLVIAIRHMGQMDEYRRLDARQDNGREGALIVEIMRGRTADSRYVADRLSGIARSVPGMNSSVSNSYQAAGFSLGGAVSTALCAADKRCRGMVNIDGAVPGVDYARLPIPHYLMVFSGANFTRFGSATGPESDHYRQRVLHDASHADFHDSAVAVPATRWFFGRTAKTIERERRETAGLIADFLNGDAVDTAR